MKEDSVKEDSVKLHDGELDIDAALVRRLVEAQFPQWAGREVRPLPNPGTDNLMFRLGDDLVARLPRMPGAVGTIRKEHRWLPWLAPRLPLAIPEPVGLGEPGVGYPLPWSASRWLDGDHRLTDLPGAAVALGDFVAALQRVDTAGAPPAYRRSLLNWDKAVAGALEDFDVPAAVGRRSVREVVSPAGTRRP